jgi:hypothetical protein
MHPLYASAMEVCEKLRETRLQAVELSSELAQAEYDLQLTKAKVERALIKQVKGEKALGPTVEDRARIFTLALDADKDFQSRLNRRNETELKLERVKAETASMQDKLRVMLAVMNAGGDHETPPPPLKQ